MSDTAPVANVEILIGSSESDPNMGAMGLVSRDSRIAIDDNGIGSVISITQNEDHPVNYLRIYGNRPSTMLRFIGLCVLNDTGESDFHREWPAPMYGDMDVNGMTVPTIITGLAGDTDSNAHRFAIVYWVTPKGGKPKVMVWDPGIKNQN